MPVDLPQPVTTVQAIQVTPAQLPQAESDQAFTIITLDQSQIEDQTRLDDALGQIPGAVLFRRTDSMVANPTTQGMSLRNIGPSAAGRALVTLDGVPMADPFGGWVIWAGLPTDLIGKATVIEGGGAGPYGAGALTGSIALDERNTQGLDVNGQYGSLNTYQGGFVDGTNIDGADVLFGASGGHSDGFVPVHKGHGAADTDTDLNDWTVNFRAITDFLDGRLAFSTGAYDQAQGAGLALANAEAKGQRASLTWARNPAGGELGYRLQAWVLNSNLQNSSVSVPTNRASTTLTNDEFNTPATGVGANAAVRGDTQTYEWELGADYRANHGEDQELFSYTASNGPLTRYAGGDTYVAGAYLDGTWKPDANWLVTGDVRADEWDDSNGHRIQVSKAGVTTLNETFPDRNGVLPTARLGVKRMTDWGYLRAAAYTGFRAPTLNELYRPFRVGNIDTESNAALTPERSAGGEVGFGSEGKVGSFDVTVFYNQLTQAIANVTTGVNARMRENAGTINATGVEGRAIWKLADHTALRINANYTDATINGLRPAETSPEAGNAGIDWTGVPHLEVNAGVSYEGARFDDDLNTIRLNPATVANLRVSWDFGKGVEGFVSADNAFNAQVENSFTSGAITYAAPRVVSIGFDLKR